MWYTIIHVPGLVLDREGEVPSRLALQAATWVLSRDRLPLVQLDQEHQNVALPEVLGRRESKLKMKTIQPAFYATYFSL